MDNRGHQAKLVMIRRVRANYRGLTEFQVRGIAADGLIENILVDGRQPDSMRTEVGSLSIVKRFPDGLEKGAIFETELSYEIIDSFPDRTESFAYAVTTETQNLRIRVQFHPEKPCISARAYSYYGGEKRTLEHPDLVRSKKGRELEFKLRKPRVGAMYSLEWMW